MLEPNWGLITSGEMFEALATSLVHSVDPKARLFGRRGNDGGQDARSSDGARVYQAKHHVTASAAKAIADAKSEAEKIQKHREPGAKRYSEWAGVTHWCLVTNALFNPGDEQRWTSEVVPVFAALGLTAERWDQATLRAMLIERPDIQQAFFEGENRVFLSIPEVRAELPPDQHFLERGALNAFLGREDELASIRAFLRSDERFLMIDGAGGVGKTRLIVEAGDLISAEGEWQVLWGSVASLGGSSAWLTGIVAERPTLLLLDEPKDPKLLERLREQQRGRMRQWKVVLTTRPANEPLLLPFLSPPGRVRHVARLRLNPLALKTAQAMCDDLLREGALKLSDTQREEIAADFARRFSGYPVWLTLAVDLLERHGNIAKIPHEAGHLASSYVDEIVVAQSETPPAQIRSLLNWVALLGTAKRNDREELNLLCQESGIQDRDELLAKLARLVERRALTARGASERLLEIKPDVLRDHLLQEWLTIDIGGGKRRPSAAAKDIIGRISAAVLDGETESLTRRMLIALGRTQLAYDFAEQPVALLDVFFDKIGTELGNISARKRLALADLLCDVAVFDPLRTASLMRQMRRSACNDEVMEGFAGSRVYGHDDVLLALARPAYRAARRARTEEEKAAAFRELCELTEAEAELAGRSRRELPNDGGRSANLLRKVIDGGRTFWATYHDVTSAEGIRLLECVSATSPGVGTLALLESLVIHALHLDRTDEWSDGDAIHIQQYPVTRSHPAWETRRQLLERAKQALEMEHTPVASRAALWHVLAKGHATANQFSKYEPEPEVSEAQKLEADELRTTCARQVHDDLAWAHQKLESGSRDFDELRAARELWSWHVEYGRASPTTELAARLEALYFENALAAEFEPLFDWDDAVEARHPRQKAATLAHDQSEAAIEAFLERASRFLGGDGQLYRLRTMMWHLGAQAIDSEPVRAFIFGRLARTEVSARTDAALDAAEGWVATQREHVPEETAQLVVRLRDASGSADQSLRLLERLYGGMHVPSHAGNVHSSEHVLVRSLESSFMAHGKGPVLLGALAFTLDHEWTALKPLLESILARLPRDQLTDGVRRLVQGAHWLIEKRERSTWPQDLVVWLLDQVARLPSPAELAGTHESWSLDQIVRTLGRMSPVWLARTLHDQVARNRHNDEGSAFFASDQRLSRYVEPLRTEATVPPETAAAIESLLDLVDDNSIGHSLPDILSDVDPEGMLVPAHVAIRAAQAESLEDLCSYAKLATAYAFGIAPWRAVARACFIRAAQLGLDPSVLFWEVSRQHSHWMASRGEVPDFFRVGVERARHSMNEDQDAVFAPFWRWRVQCAEADLLEAQARAKEERGE